MGFPNRDSALRAATKVLIVDDHEGFRAALRDVLNHSSNVCVIGEAVSGQDCIDQVRRGLDVDVILMDVSMPQMSGIDATQEVMRIRPDVAVIALTMHKRRDYEKAATAAGAKGFVLKGGPVSVLETAIDKVAQGEMLRKETSDE